MQAKNTAPFDVSKSTNQELRPITSITKSNYKYFESSCALACPVPIAIGKHRAGLDFFFLILRITHLHQGKKNI